VDIAKLDSTFREAHSVFELPGFAIGIIKGNKIVYKKGFGKTELTDQGKNVTDSSLFHMASISKTFCCYGNLATRRCRKIKLDAPLTDYIPYFKMSDDRYRQVTIRQMLMHTSAIPDVKDYDRGTFSWNYSINKSIDLQFFQFC
jgi:CubicO group peptidase (beta-lactamase class C family)